MTRNVMRITFAVAVVNFLAFVFVTTQIGGDALNGHSDHGRYYLSDHGKLTEVSKAVYVYSLCHALSLLITHPLAIYAGWVWRRRSSN